MKGKLADAPTSRVIIIEYPDQINIRIDVNILKEELQADPRVKTIYEKLGDAVRVAINPDCPREPKEVIMSFFERFKLNPAIKDIDIRKHPYVMEPDSIIVYNAETNSTLLTIKVLKTVLTEDIIKAYQNVRSGTDTVTMPVKD